MLDEMGAFVLMHDQMREFWLLGESVSYNFWDDATSIHPLSIGLSSITDKNLFLK